MAEYVEPTQFLGGGLCGAALLIGRGKTRELKCDQPNLSSVRLLVLIVAWR